jgi:transcriptional regulator with XRE-family HTH domain
MRRPFGAIHFDGHRLQTLRQRRGVSVEDLSIASSVSARHIWRLEAGERPNTSAVTLARVAQALNTTLEYLLGLTDDVRGIRELTTAALNVQEMDDENRPAVV